MLTDRDFKNAISSPPPTSITVIRSVVNRAIQTRLIAARRIVPNEYRLALVPSGSTLQISRAEWSGDYASIVILVREIYKLSGSLPFHNNEFETSFNSQLSFLVNSMANRVKATTE